MRFFEIDLNTIPKITLIGRETINPTERHTSRYTSDYILYAVTEGMLSLMESGRELVLKKGDVCIFKKGDYQEPFGVSDGAFYFVHFKTDSFTERALTDEEYDALMKEKREKNLTRTLTNPNCYDGVYALLKQEYRIRDSAFFDYIVKAIERCISDCRHFEPERFLSASTRLGKILLRLEDYGVSESVAVKGGGYGKNYQLTEKIVRYLEENYNKNISSRDIEDAFKISFDYANRLFKKIMDTTIMKYHSVIRIEKAKVHLSVSNKSILEIAEEIGIADAYYFGRLFKKIEGISPGQYRKNHSLTGVVRT